MVNCACPKSASHSMDFRHCLKYTASYEGIPLKSAYEPGIHSWCTSKLLPTTTQHSSTMSPIHYVAMPESDTEVIEEATYLQRTTRGTKIKQTRNRKEQPSQDTAGQASRSRSKTKRTSQLQEVNLTLQEADSSGRRIQSRSKRSDKLRHVDEPVLVPDGIDHLDAYEPIDDWPDEPLEPVGEVPQAQACVLSSLFCHYNIANSMR